MADDTTQPQFYHFTCEHGKRGIEKVKEVRPLGCWWQAMAVAAGGKITTAPNVLWLTDLPQPDAKGLGLSSNIIDCDRTQYRFEVAPHPKITPWTVWADEHGVNQHWREMLERDRTPEHWFVCTLPVRVVSGAVQVT